MLQRTQTYAIGLAMRHYLHATVLGLAAICMALSACDSLKKKHDFDLYAMPTPGQRIDNDAYYRPPVGQCRTIYDAPSCGI